MERSARMHRIQCRRRMLSVVHLVFMSWLTTASVTTAEEIAISKATTSRAAREDAIRDIPFHSLSQQARTRILSVVRRPTLFRRMPVSMIDCDPEMHRFLVRYPEVVVNVWQLMGITKVTAERIAPYKLNIADGVGTITNMELIYGNRDTHVIFCEGCYEGPLFRKPLTGRCVLLLKSGFVKTDAGRHQITNRLDVFLQVDHVGINIFAKTLHPFLGKSADVNFLESMRFLQRLSQAAEKNGPGMQHLADRLAYVENDVRSKFHQVVDNVNARHAHRMGSTQPAGKEATRERATASVQAATLPKSRSRLGQREQRPTVGSSR